MRQAVQLLHSHTKSLHKFDRHVDVGLADQLVLDDDLNAPRPRGQRGGHQQRCQVLRRHAARQLHLLFSFVLVLG